ncbi:MAG: DUF1289 domain-containing protein [Hyphomicrobiales bacterium]
MTDQFRSTITSPCVNVCVVDPDSDLCIGCGRTRTEIAGWLSYSPQERDEVTASLPERLATLTRNKRRKGGARERRKRVME